MKGHFEDHVIATSVKNGLGLADLALGPGGGLGDLLSLFYFDFAPGNGKKTHLNILFP